MADLYVPTLVHPPAQASLPPGSGSGGTYTTGYGPPTGTPTTNDAKYTNKTDSSEYYWDSNLVMWIKQL